MRIFLGSSTESLQLAKRLALWIEECGHTPLLWDDIGVFPLGQFTFESLVHLTAQIDGAILLFAADDRVWYRGQDTTQPRDNVLLEYGLFAGTLGRDRAIVCLHGDPKLPVDLKGITTLSISSLESPHSRARLELEHWLKLHASVKSPDLTARQMAMLRRWEGVIDQPDYQGGPISSKAVITLTSDGKRVIGDGIIDVDLTSTHRGGPRTVQMALRFAGSFFHADFIVMEYRPSDGTSLQFGTMLLHLNAEATELSGRFVGFGSISESIISGAISLRRSG